MLLSSEFNSDIRPAAPHDHPGATAGIENNSEDMRQRNVGRYHEARAARRGIPHTTGDGPTTVAEVDENDVIVAVETRLGPLLHLI